MKTHTHEVSSVTGSPPIIRSLFRFSRFFAERSDRTWSTTCFNCQLAPCNVCSLTSIFDKYDDIAVVDDIRKMSSFMTLCVCDNYDNWINAHQIRSPRYYQYQPSDDEDSSLATSSTSSSKDSLAAFLEEKIRGWTFFIIAFSSFFVSVGRKRERSNNGKKHTLWCELLLTTFDLLWVIQMF